MSVTHATSVAQSALEAAATRLAVSAHNVANINTEGYEAKDVAVEDVQSGGGISQVVAMETQVPVGIRQDDLLASAATDVVRETINRVRAVVAYRANAEVFRTATDVSTAIIDSV